MLRDFIILLQGPLNPGVIKDAIVIDEGVKEWALTLMSEEEERAEDEWLDGFLDAKEVGGELTSAGVVGREEVDGDEAGEENVADADGGEEVHFFLLNKMPDPVDQWDSEGESDGDIRAELIPFFPSFTALAQDHDREQDIDDDVGEGIILLGSRFRYGRVWGGVFF